MASGILFDGSYMGLYSNVPLSGNLAFPIFEDNHKVLRVEQWSIDMCTEADFRSGCRNLWQVQFGFVSVADT